MPALFQLSKLNKSFQVAANRVPVLKNIDLAIETADFAVIFGPSGCGKSTLLHTMLGLEEPDSGQVRFFDQDLYQQLDEDARADFRKKYIGMVYQQPNWLRALSVLDNVVFPLQLLGQDKKTALPKAQEALQLVEMSAWANYAPSELSSGQQQRVALARALVINPAVIVADEPTGNLDYEAGQELMQLLKALNQQAQKTIIMVTHDLEYLSFAKTAIRMFNGQIIGVYGEKDKAKLMTELQHKSGQVSKKLSL